MLHCQFAPPSVGQYHVQAVSLARVLQCHVAMFYCHAGRLFRMTSLQLSSEVRASTPAPPPKSGTQGKKQPASKAKTKGAKKRKRRSSSSDDDDDDDYSGSDGDFRADLDGRGSMRQSPAPAAQAGPAQQAAGRSSSAAGGGKARRQRLSAAATAAAVHTWQQPDSLAALLFDVAALRAALVKGEGAAARQPRTLCHDICLHGMAQ